MIFTGGEADTLRKAIGKKKLDAYLKKRGAAPANFVNILAGLMEFGLRPFGEDAHGPKDPFAPQHLPPSVETF